MKVSYISTYPPIRCGIAYYTKSLTDALNQLGGVDFEVLANLTFEKKQRPSFVVPIWIKNKTLDIWHICKKNREAKPDIIHIQFHPGLYGNLLFSILLTVAVLFTKPNKSKFIITFHTLPIPSLTKKVDRFFKTKIIKFLLKKSDKVIVHTQKMKEVLLQEFNFNLQKISVMSMGCLPAKNIEINKAKKMLGLENKIILFSPVLLRPGTKIELLIKAFANLQKKIHNLYLVCVGLSPNSTKENGYLESIKHLIQTKKIKNIKIIENQHEFDNYSNLYMSAADLLYFLHDDYPSADCSLAIYNSLPYHKIVIVSDVPKFSEVTHYLRKIKADSLIMQGNLCIADQIKSIEKAIQFSLNKNLNANIIPQLNNFIKQRTWQQSAEILKNIYHTTLHEQ